ncbi:MAG: sigma-70 family RNA polymerase sigma factor [Spirochaetota bacterium]|nr:sigma-70 family RNA polymerase sigma factor [Spirochaetota bacterium]
MSDANDIEIIDRVLSGDIDSFSEIIKKYNNRIFRYAYSKVGNYEEALDITQDILVVIFEALKSFRRESKLSTWIYSIMVNYCMNYKKRKEKYSYVSINRINGNDEFELQLSDDKQNPEKETIDSESLRILKDELYKLPNDYKEILILRDIDGLPYNDIAGILGVNLSNVKVRIHRGRGLLKKRLVERDLI